MTPTTNVTLDQFVAAGEVKSSDGKLYRDRPNKELEFVRDNEKTPPEKAKAAATILQWRKQNQLSQEAPEKEDKPVKFVAPPTREPEPSRDMKSKKPSDAGAAKIPNSLAAKIAAASISVGGFEPDKINLEQKYKYISADAILARGGNALAAQGVSIFPSVESVKIDFVQRPGKSDRIDASCEYCFFITDGESSVSINWFGFGSDYMTPDKAVYKAYTSGHKYFLMKLLNIGAGNEDGEHE